MIRSPKRQRPPKTTSTSTIATQVWDNERNSTELDEQPLEHYPIVGVNYEWISMFILSAFDHFYRLSFIYSHLSILNNINCG